MSILFYIALFWIFYTYAGYPLLLVLLTLSKKVDISNKDCEPRITMIISAYNEEKSIGKKILNCLELDYPKEKLEIIIVSDGSTDRTEEIVSSYASEGITLIRMNERQGKTYAQNYAVSKAGGEILVFSDATTIYKKDAINKLVRNFCDKKIGIVAGEEEFMKNDDSRIHKEVSLSWKYEKLLRRLESKFNSMISVSGCIFAIRRDLYEKINGTLIEDFALPLTVLEKGYKVYLEPEAIGYEEAVMHTGDEFKRKVRIVSGGINVLFSMKRLLNPFRNFNLAFQLVSHKVFRWLTPIFLVLLFVSNLFLVKDGSIFKIFFTMQAVCYILAIAGFAVRERALNIKIFKIPFYFCLVNIACIVGIFRFVYGDNKVMWEPIR